jgi:hypothetical protein
LSRAIWSERAAAAAPSLAWRAKMTTIQAEISAAQTQPTRRLVMPAIESDDRSMPSAPPWSDGPGAAASAAGVGSSSSSGADGAGGFGARRKSTFRES